jgi:hypothetical protein
MWVVPELWAALVALAALSGDPRAERCRPAADRHPSRGRLTEEASVVSTLAQLLRLDVGEEEVRSPALVRRNRHRAENVSGATRETYVVGCSREGPAVPGPLADAEYGGATRR